MSISICFDNTLLWLAGIFVLERKSENMLQQSHAHRTDNGVHHDVITALRFCFFSPSQ